MTKGKRWEFRPQRRWSWAVLHIGHILVNNNIFDLCHLKLNGDSPENGPHGKGAALSTIEEEGSEALPHQTKDGGAGEVASSASKRMERSG